MIQVLFNNTILQTEKNASLSAVLKLHNYPAKGIAVILNQNLVPYSQYDHTLLNEGDRIEIMLPMQGG